MGELVVGMEGAKAARREAGFAGCNCLGAHEMPVGGFVAALPGVCGTSENAGKHIKEGQQKENDLGENKGGVDGQPYDHDPLKGMAIGQVDFFPAPEAPGTDHQQPDQEDQQHPHDGDPPVGHRRSGKEMDHSGNHAGGRGNGHAHKVFSSRTSRILGQQVGADIKARQAAGAAEQKKKAEECAPLHHVLPAHGIHGRGQHLETPGEGQEAGSDAEGNHVRQRIELFAEVAGGFGHARDAAIDGVKGDGKADGQGSIVEMPRLLHRSLQALHNSEVAGGDIACGEERRHDIHAAAQPAPSFCRAGGRGRAAWWRRHSSETLRQNVERSFILCRLDIGQHRGASLDPLPQGHPEVGMARQYNIHPGAELDQADALAALYKIAWFKAEDDAPRQDTRDLAEDHIELIPLHGHHILLVLFADSGSSAFRCLPF